MPPAPRPSHPALPLAPAESDYARYLKPRIAQLLGAFGLDASFHRSVGDELFTRGPSGEEVAVTDMVGGFGSTLFGHNHPELVALAQQALSEQRPSHAQVSVRSPAGTLARRLSERVGRDTGREYVATLANSGAEAVEAALKHAELERSLLVHDVARGAREALMRARRDLERGTVKFAPDTEERLEAVLGSPHPASIDAVGAMLELVHVVQESRPVVVGVSGSFHGKSTGAVQLTQRPEYRLPWSRLGPESEFLPRNDVAALTGLSDRYTLHVPTLERLPGGLVSPSSRPVPRATAFFVEPIQGEGGIHPLEAPFLAALRRLCDELEVPLIIDEIQSGMGRCGRFLASSATGVVGDYYLFGKALGGGIAKVSALLVDRARYVEDFGFLHTSTFAEDDFSSLIGCLALDLLDADDGALIRRAEEVGDDLKTRLRALAERHPGFVQDVRGEGLLIGVELTSPIETDSPLLRTMSAQGLLVYLVAGYLLREHHVRVAPALSDRAVVRIEPSLFVSREACDRLVRGLEAFFEAVRSGRVIALLGPLLSSSDESGSSEPEPTRSVGRGTHRSRQGVSVTRRLVSADSAGRSKRAVHPEVPRVAFLVNLPSAAQLADWDHHLSAVDEARCAALLERTKGVLRPFQLDEAEFRSIQGNRVDLVVIGVPFTSQQAITSMRQGDDWCLDLVREALVQALESGCSVAGLGGHTSVVSEGGRRLLGQGIGLTSGNSLSVAAALTALRGAATERGVDLSESRLGVVGAGGNVGMTIAELLAPEVGSLTLIGREGSDRFLRRLASRIYGEEWYRSRNGGPAGGIARAVGGALDGPEISRASAGDRIWRMFNDGKSLHPPIDTSTEMDDLRGCQVVITATNAPAPVLHAHHIDDGPVVVCDVAIPRDVDPDLEVDRPHAVVVRGGLVRAPLGQTLDIPVLGLNHGELYGCLAETLILGLVGFSDDFSCGPLSADRIEQIQTWAEEHGFVCPPLEALA